MQHIHALRNGVRLVSVSMTFGHLICDLCQSCCLRALVCPTQWYCAQLRQVSLSIRTSVLGFRHEASPSVEGCLIGHEAHKQHKAIFGV